ncbi:flagellar hook-basal body complex protein FliE [Thioalkalivibrio sp. XN279]|uniref:flagellar hook-basal body complex protein FliE n=1 Tax=Thioalkalivibrio sp. XN279 TaxID=2714953 RepID=UPI00140925E7|nr:flagellar hook-basal body complex protein FliE [Thioalkalivibrio sp. XN279]NHA13369.1 flagellar hook-basal body complex protein FliE [Thioalkalivibrio sp. XN279]
MSDMQIQQVIHQMRALAARSPTPAPQAEGPAGTGFGALLQQSVNAVSKQQAEASQLAEAFQRNDPGVSLPQVMVSMQKSSLAFEATVQVRNRLLQAYQDIMNMQV